MRNSVIYFLLIFAVTFSSCTEIKKCEDVACFTPPQAFLFELVDTSTGENLFTSGKLKSGDITVVSLDNQSNVDFDFIGENDYNIIRIHSIGWESQVVNYSLQIASENIVTIHADAERVYEDCCSFTRFHELDIDGSDIIQDVNSGIYKVKLDIEE